MLCQPTSWNPNHYCDKNNTIIKFDQILSEEAVWQGKQVTYIYASDCAHSQTCFCNLLIC